METKINTRPVNRFERRKQRTREQLKRAVIELILEKGYDEVSVQDITERADLGRGTFYVHYTDKEDVVWQSLREGFDAVDQDIHQRYAGLKSPILEYLSWIQIFEYAAEHRDLFRVLLGGRGSAMLTARFIDYMVNSIEQEIEAGYFHPPYRLPTKLISQFTMGGLVRLLIWWLEDPNEYTPKQMGAAFFEMIFHQPPPDDEALPKE